MVTTLSRRKQTAFNKLTNVWQSPRRMRMPLATFQELHKMGLVDKSVLTSQSHLPENQHTFFRLPKVAQ